MLRPHVTHITSLRTSLCLFTILPTSFQVSQIKARMERADKGACERSVFWNRLVDSGHLDLGRSSRSRGERPQSWLRDAQGGLCQDVEYRRSYCS